MSEEVYVSLGMADRVEWVNCKVVQYCRVVQWVKRMALELCEHASRMHEQRLVKGVYCSNVPGMSVRGRPPGVWT